MYTLKGNISVLVIGIYACRIVLVCVAQATYFTDKCTLGASNLIIAIWVIYLSVALMLPCQWHTTFTKLICVSEGD